MDIVPWLSTTRGELPAANDDEGEKVGSGWSGRRGGEEVEEEAEREARESKEGRWKGESRAWNGTEEVMEELSVAWSS